MALKEQPVTTPARIKLESIRDTLSRYGYLHEVTADMRDAYASKPWHVESLASAFGWTPADGCGRDMRRLVDAFHRYATLVRETTGQRVAVRDLVECLLTMVVG